MNDKMLLIILASICSAHCVSFSSSPSSSSLPSIDDIFNDRNYRLLERQIARDYGYENGIDTKQLNNQMSMSAKTPSNGDTMSTKGVAPSGQCFCACDARSSGRAGYISLLSPMQNMRMKRIASFASKMYHKTHDPLLLADQSLVPSPAMCDFTRSPCGWLNDAHAASRFKYGFENFFNTKLWFVDSSGENDGAAYRPLEQRHINKRSAPTSLMQEPESLSSLYGQSTNSGWARLVSPYYHNAPNVTEACVMIHFDLIGEGRDTLVLIVQDDIGTRSILDYKHDRVNNVEESVLRKLVPFRVVGDARFFMQFEFLSNYNDNHYGFKYFHIRYEKCTFVNKIDNMNIDAYNN